MTWVSNPCSLGETLTSKHDLFTHSCIFRDSIPSYDPPGARGKYRKIAVSEGECSNNPLSKELSLAPYNVGTPIQLNIEIKENIRIGDDFCFVLKQLGQSRDVV